MYCVSKRQKDNLDYLELKNPHDLSIARICLNQGGRLDELVVNNINIIEATNASEYKNNYASAIMFPFANRIKNGEYTFNNLNYKLKCNEVEKNNALHGLVYDKAFVCIAKDLTSSFGSVTLRYKSDGNTEGFPFKYRIELTYKLSQESISLEIQIINEDKKEFPFTLGWHPYFESSDLYNSSLNFKSKSKFKVDNQQIPIKEIPFNGKLPHQIKDTKLDDGYILEGDKINFTTPDYQLQIQSNINKVFLQLYTPNKSNSIAIEPMTGAADAFNNKIGLKTLNPNQDFKVKWKLDIKNLMTY